MKLAKYLATVALVLSLVVLPVLPTESADAASRYVTNYKTTYYYSYSVPTQTVNYTTTYKLYYDTATGKYYWVQQPASQTPVTPGNTGNAGNSGSTGTPAKPQETPTQPQKPAPSPSTPSNASSFEMQVVELVNQERAKAGLKPLTYDAQLSQVARLKSQDMRDKKYFSHTSPTYGSPFDMMKKYGISYRTAGENIAAGQATPAQVVQAWMNSSGHRANILNSQYTHIGVGYAQGGSYGHYWTQMFIGK
ncbi:MAG TPA: hypothetical protein GXX34_02665 [Clostridia bacterium]|nr:hypothetical protein [Clostridia bacterium]